MPIIPVPSEIRVAPRPRVVITHNERTPLTTTIASVLGLVIAERPR